MKVIARSLGKAVMLLLSISVIAFSTACSRQATESASSSKSLHTFTSANFQSEVLSSTQPVLVDFWATWCGPCRTIAPIVSQLADEFEGRAKVGKVDVDAETALAKQYNISAIPSLLIFKDGKVVEQFVGLRGKEELSVALAKHAGESAIKSTAPAP